MGVPKVYRAGSTPVTFNFDFFDFINGVGYKKLYFGAMITSAANQYILTPDATLTSDDSNVKVAANGTFNIDFDIEFENPAIVAGADATISYTVVGGAGNTFAATFTIYHVDSGATETQIGTVIAETASGITSSVRKSVNVSLTRQEFRPGEKLRVTGDFISNAPGCFMLADPSGRVTAGGDVSTSTNNSSAFISVPFEVGL